MSTDVTRAGQRAAQAQMTLTLALYEPNGTTEDADGYEVIDYLPHGRTCGKVQSGSAQGLDTATRYVDIGGVSRPVLEAGLHIPLSATLPKPDYQQGVGWEYEVVKVDGLADCALLGRRYLVVEVPAKSFATARRLDVIEL